MKKIIWIIIVLAILIVIGIYYYNSNVKANIINDGTFVEFSNKCRI